MAAEESLDGRQLYFARNDTAGIWQMPLGGGSETLVFATVREGDWGNWAVADEGFYFVERAETHPVLAFYSISKGAVTSRISIRTAGTWSVPWSTPSLAVSPDGQRVLFTQIDRMERDILLVDQAF